MKGLKRPRRAALAANIRRAIADSGYSHEELATKLHVSRRAVWSWAAGRTVPRQQNLHALAVECGVPVEFFDQDPPVAASPLGGQPIQLLARRWDVDADAWVVDVRVVLRGDPEVR